MENIDGIIKRLNKEIDFTGQALVLADVKSPDIIPTGIDSLNDIIGAGGIPRGLITEVYGNPSCGKTSLCLKMMAEAQKMDIKVAYIDLELALSQELALMMGVDVNDILVVRPANGEEAFEAIENLSENGFGLIVLDSVASISATSELEADYNEQTVALQARLLSKALRKLNGCIMRNNTALVFINQIRAKMAKMPGAKTTTTSGGIAIPFYASLRLELARKGWVTPSGKDNNERLGMEVIIHTEKNKLKRPQLSTVVNFMFRGGWDTANDKLNIMIKNGEVELIGLTYHHKGEKVGVKKKMLEYIKNNL